MYTLRTISKNETVNVFLGEAYVRIDRLSQADNFRKVYKDTFGKDHVADLDDSSDNISKAISCFIIGKEVYLVFEDEFAYIVGATGDTFECISNPNKVGRKVN